MPSRITAAPVIFKPSPFEKHFGNSDQGVSTFGKSPLMVSSILSLLFLSHLPASTMQKELDRAALPDPEAAPGHVAPHPQDCAQEYKKGMKKNQPNFSQPSRVYKPRGKQQMSLKIHCQDARQCRHIWRDAGSAPIRVAELVRRLHPG